MKEVQKLRFGLGFQVEAEKGPVDLYSVNADGDVSGTYVQATDYDELLRERNELAAHVERLTGALVAAANDIDDWLQSHRYDEESVSIVVDARRAINETPAQSLEAVKREWNVPTVENGKNRYGLDVSYFRNLFNRELNGTLQNYKPDELARNLLRMARAADSSVFKEREFSELFK